MENDAQLQIPLLYEGPFAGFQTLEERKQIEEHMAARKAAKEAADIKEGLALLKKKKKRKSKNLEKNKGPSAKRSRTNKNTPPSALAVIGGTIPPSTITSTLLSSDAVRSQIEKADQDLGVKRRLSVTDKEYFITTKVD